MKNRTKRIIDGVLSAGLLLAVGSGAGCTEDSADVAYETGYAGDYYYPADVGYAGGFVGGGYYAAAPAGTVREAVGTAIRETVMGTDVCAGAATVTPQTGADVCGDARTGVKIVFSGCQLAGGGTLDGTVEVKLNRSGSDTNCNGSTTITVGYTSTLTDLTYTGTGGGKIVIPSQMSTATLSYPFGTPPTSISLTTTGEIQRIASGGSTSSDRTYTGTHMLTSISVANQSYTLSGLMNLTDKSGGTASVTGTDLTRDTSCCRPTGGTLSVSRSGGSHAGTHSWTFTPTCGSAMLDDKTVSLPDCL